jgi:hypothetical protein
MNICDHNQKQSLAEQLAPNLIAYEKVVGLVYLISGDQMAQSAIAPCDLSAYVQQSSPRQ